MLDPGVDCMTSGNHIWDKKEIIGFIDLIPQLLRPLNYPEGQPGQGSHVGKGKRQGPGGHPQLLGRVFMNGSWTTPSASASPRWSASRKEAKIVIVDFHGEATSKKTALGYYLDGKVTAVVGTHTHVPTCDHRPAQGHRVLHRPGNDRALRIGHRRGVGDDRPPLPDRHARTLRDGEGRSPLRAVVVTADPETGRAKGIERMLAATEEDVRGIGGLERRERADGLTPGDGWTGRPFEE